MEPLRLPAIRPRELLIVAGTGGRPTARSTGKLTKVPEPTTALMPPAANPATATATISHPVMRTSLSSLARPADRPPQGGQRSSSQSAERLPPPEGLPLVGVLGQPGIPAPQDPLQRHVPVRDPV